MFMTRNKPDYSFHADSEHNYVQHMWPTVEQTLNSEWFYVSVMRIDSEGKGFSSMVMLSSVEQLEQMVTSQTEQEWIQEVFLVTPKYLNKGPGWKMERLLTASLIEDVEGQLGPLYEVEEGQYYEPSLTIEDSADLHMKRVVYSQGENAV